MKTEIVFLLDRSGSMGGLEGDTIGGYNAFIKKQLEHAGDTFVTTVLFDDAYEVLHDGVNAKGIHLTNKDYYVRGSTALLDSVGRTILNVGNRLANQKEEDRPNKVIFVITTDGMENASREFSYEKISELIKHQTEKYNWEFIFLGANIDVAKEADRMGIASDNAVSFCATGFGVAEMYNQVDYMVSKARKKRKETAGGDIDKNINCK